MADLKGACVLVTRPAHQADNLCRLIVEQGGEAIRFPTLEIMALAETDSLINEIANLGGIQWLVFVSANAVNFALKANGGKISRLNPMGIAAVGQATALALKSAGLPVDLMPAQNYSSEALLAMPQWRQVNGQRFLIVRGEGGREELATTLRNRGAEVIYWDVYKRVIPNIDSSEVLGLLRRRKLNAVTVTSGEALQNLLIMLDQHYHHLLFSVPLTVISDRVGQMAVDMGFKQIAVSANPSDAAILKAVTICLTGE